MTTLDIIWGIRPNIIAFIAGLSLLIRGKITQDIVDWNAGLKTIGFSLIPLASHIIGCLILFVLINEALSWLGRTITKLLF